jgi:hypothetical protein
MTNILRRSLTLALKAGIFAPCCSVCIWWAYSMGAPGSFHTRHEAVLLTIQMAMLTTCLTAVVWIASWYIHKKVTWLSLGMTRFRFWSRTKVGILFLPAVEASCSRLPKIRALGVKPLAASRTPGLVGDRQHDQPKQYPSVNEQMEAA